MSVSVNQEILLKDLLGQQVCIFFNPEWKFEASLINTVDGWGVTELVYFHNSRHKSLAFMFPYYVIEFQLEPSSICRAILIHTYPGKDLSMMSGTISQFTGLIKGTVARIFTVPYGWHPSQLTNEINHLLSDDLSVQTISCIKYKSPLHRSQKGYWEQVF